MTDIAELHAQALDATGAIVAGIPADRWHADTPCEGWDVRALVNHVVSGNLWAAELAPAGRSRTWATASTATCSARIRPAPTPRRRRLRPRFSAAPGALDAPCAVSYGPVPGSVYAGHRFIDVFIHGWDLAAATGQDTTLDADLMQACREVIEPQLEAFRGAGALAGPLPVPPGASGQTRFAGHARPGRMTPATAAGPAQELLARAASRESVRPDDARAGASYERMTIGGDAYFVKRLSPASDWIMRVTGDHVHRPYLVWQAGIMDRAPDCIDHTVVAMDVDGDGRRGRAHHGDARRRRLPRSRPATRSCHPASTTASSRTWPPSAPRSGAGTTTSA